MRNPRCVRFYFRTYTHEWNLQRVWTFIDAFARCYGFSRGAPISPTKNTMRAVRAAREVMQSRYRRVGAVYGYVGRCTYHRGSKYLVALCMRAARALKKSEFEFAFARPSRAARRRVDQRWSNSCFRVSRRDAEERKKRGWKEGKGTGCEEREKQQSKPCRATAVARVAVHNKNRRCFNVTNICICVYIFFPAVPFHFISPTATRLI